MNYLLTRTETNRKDARFLYVVTDENGVEISRRSSNREYVACTIHGSYYFGRLDLIGKGDHGKRLKKEALGTLVRNATDDGWLRDGKPIAAEPIAYLKKD